MAPHSNKTKSALICVMASQIPIKLGFVYVVQVESITLLFERVENSFSGIDYEQIFCPVGQCVINTLSTTVGL